MKDPNERFTLVTISVQVRCNGRGMSAGDIKKTCKKLAKSALGKATTRMVSAECGSIGELATGKYY